MASRFELLRLTDSVPPPRPDRIDVALLDMNHSWPNVGHDALVNAVREAAGGLGEELDRQGAKVRVLSFDVRRRLLVPEPGRFPFLIGTGGPGHLDPRLNDGVEPWSQGIAESADWEAPLFRLFDAVLADESSAMLAVCHSFGLVCRWSGIARPDLREEKSSGMPLNRLSDEARHHPWFSQFAHLLPDRQHFRVIDNRLFDLLIEDPGKSLPIAFDVTSSAAVTMVELARDRSGTMPRFLGVNHHPEIIDREHAGEVTDAWYIERRSTMQELFRGENERQSRLTSHYTLLAPLRFHLERIVRER
jgi:hypothetical protein